MLVLTRKLNEAIQIGDEIEIKVLAIDGDQIKLGINAPKSVEIYRKEIYQDIQKQNSEAANVPDNLLNILNEKGDKQ
jgi:carbon storage regulator